jgi:hypothetical protein
MISLQFILTLAVISVVLFIVLLFILAFAYYELYAPDLLVKIPAISLLVLVFAWLLFGSFLCLNAVWGWGLVK